MEIERKFLVTDLSKVDLTKYPHETITQDYLFTDDHMAIRKRKIERDNKNIYKITIKSNKIGISVNEVELNIDEQLYNSLLPQSKKTTICKDRYKIPYDDLTIELDIFKGVFKGLIFAEIEFESEKQAYSTLLPIWFEKDISNKITNAEMSNFTSLQQCIDKINKE